MYYLLHIPEILNFVGTLVILWGSVLALLQFVKNEFQQRPLSSASLTSKNQLRQDLGVYILLGLEFMIAADIIHTIFKPDNQTLIILGAIVVIRTFIAYFLNQELKHGASIVVHENDDTKK